MIRAGITFREVMVGTLTQLADPTAAVDIEVALLVEVRDLDAFLSDPSHAGAISGEIRSRALGGSFPVEAGTLELFPADGAHRGAEMRYRIAFRAARGTLMSLRSLKTLHRGNVGGVWRDVTVSESLLVEGPSGAEAGPTVAAGTIRITPAAVVREMTTIRGRGDSVVARAASVLRFGAFFARSVLTAYRPR